MWWIIAFVLASSAAAAKDLTVDDQSQNAIQNICDMAATNTAVQREVRAQVAAFCVQWQQRLQQNAAAPDSKAPDPPPAGAKQ